MNAAEPVRFGFEDLHGEARRFVAGLVGGEAGSVTTAEGGDLTDEDKDLIRADLLDPDNWIVIPEFGVKPIDVGFSGFQFPICRGRLPLNGDWRKLMISIQIRSVVRSLRQAIRGSVSSLEEMRTVRQERLQQIYDAEDSGIPCPSPSLAESAAIVYEMVEINLCAAITALSLDPISSQLSLSMAAAHVASALAGDVDRLAEVAAKAGPFIAARGRKPSHKTEFYRALIKQNPSLQNLQLANRLVDELPAIDDGQHPFFWGAGHRLMDRSSMEETTVDLIRGQIAKARARMDEKDT